MATSANAAVSGGGTPAGPPRGAAPKMRTNARELDERDRQQDAEERQREDEMARFGRRGRVERRKHERERRYRNDARDENHDLAPPSPQEHRTDQREEQHRDRPRVMSGAEVAGHPPKVVQNRRGRAELRST